MTLTRRQQLIEHTAARPCPNCHEHNLPGVDECYGCGWDGHCHTCREPTQFSEFPDLNYCSTVCARQGQAEREVEA